MKQFQVNELVCCINNVDLHDCLYVSVTIGTGFSPREIQVNGEHLFIGAAAAKIFSNYIQTTMEKKHDIDVTATVSVKSTSFLWKTTTNHYMKELQLLIKELYEGEIDEEQLATVKQATIERYKQNYKDLEFRGRMKIQEFTHANKSFELDRLSKDLLDVNLSVIQNMRKHLFVPTNTCIFCHGKADQEELEQLTIPKVAQSRATYLYDLKNDRFLQDQTFRQASKGNFWCGSMRFERSSTFIDLEKEYVVLNLLADLMSKGAYMVEVDALDASIVYDQDRTDGKIDLKELITDDSVQIAKKRIYHRLERELQDEPVHFTEKVGRLFVSQINYFRCLSYLDQMTAHDIHDFLNGRDYQIREASVIYYKEANKHVI